MAIYDPNLSLLKRRPTFRQALNRQSDAESEGCKEIYHYKVILNCMKMCVHACSNSDTATDSLCCKLDHSAASLGRDTPINVLKGEYLSLTHRSKHHNHKFKIGEVR